MQARLHRQAETAGLVDRLTFIDFVAGDQKWGLLHAAELFCLPSHQENFGIAIVEALACGTPVLISNKVNIHSDITLARAGLVVDDSVDGVVAGLAQWLILPDEGRQRMRDAARPTFERQFHISRAVDDLLSFAGPIAHRGLAAAAVGNRAKVTR
jgi:glycosyltransferase involved in cell wall biosynthesis